MTQPEMILIAVFGTAMIGAPLSALVWVIFGSHRIFARKFTKMIARTMYEYPSAWEKRNQYGDRQVFNRASGVVVTDYDYASLVTMKMDDGSNLLVSAADRNCIRRAVKDLLLMKALTASPGYGSLLR